ncbi:MAG: uroporphyrinogen-III synthase [Deltaproteobacteria bacterium]|nr:uroporphyrinogen-III synthase [Deltaproteobacteria bacterium]
MSPDPHPEPAAPLDGKCVLVLRPQKERDRTAALLAASGAEVRMLPLTVIEPTRDDPAVRRAIDRLVLGVYDLVTFTSENAVRCFVAELVRGPRGLEPLRRTRLAAIGPATAGALQDLGLEVAVVAETFVAEGLVDAILALEPPPRTMLLPRAMTARELLPDALRASGIEVDVAPVYRTVEAPPERARALASLLPGCDAILLTASSTVDQLCRALGANPAQALRGVVLASIGPVTTSAAEAQGLHVAVTAVESTVPALVEALAFHFAGQTSPSG